MTDTGASVLSVNVLHALRPGYFHETAIDKRPVAGPVEVGADGLAGDRQIDSSHGGADRAVYAYADEDAAFWAGELDRDIPLGLFGENLRTRGLDVTGALIGEQWRVGTALLEVRMPRTPCQNLALRMGIEGFHLRFNESGRVGAMLRVLEPGAVAAGDVVEVVARPAHEVTVGLLATGPSGAQYQAMLDSGAPLARKVRAKAQRVAARGVATA
jgi:MOSC domain-containing protein YiiM